MTIDPPKKPKGRSRNVNLAAAVDATVAGVFNLTAVLTQHRHWLKDSDEVKPITEPLNAWMDQLPARQLKAFEEKICPILLGVGIATVLVPDIVLEVKLRARNRHLAWHEEQSSQQVSAEAVRPEARTWPPFISVDNGGSRTGPSSAASTDGDDTSHPPQIPGVPF